MNNGTDEPALPEGPQREEERETMTPNELFMEALAKRRLDFDHLCARANQIRCMKGIARDEKAREALLEDILSQIGDIASHVWLEAGGRS